MSTTQTDINRKEKADVEEHDDVLYVYANAILPGMQYGQVTERGMLFA